jgi:hypothetical protein
MAKETEPFKGAKDLERMAKEIDHGGDPNADLNAVDTDATKAEAGLTLKMSGASYTTIAKTLGYSSAYRARMAVERVLASAANSPEDREKMRVLTSRRINRLLQSVMGKAVDPADPQHLAYNARALALVDREARLWGVDAPTQVQISATDEHIQEYVARMSGLARAGVDADEADIIDADVVEGEI